MRGAVGCAVGEVGQHVRGWQAVDQWHGTNAFIRDGDQILRTYFIHDRGDEQLGSTWSYLDIAALGRQEEWEDSPDGYPQTPPYQWWNYHDAYGTGT
jgi:predicted dithiol-disulfide oxidoreductase (DUF899 family)